MKKTLLMMFVISLMMMGCAKEKKEETIKGKWKPVSLVVDYHKGRSKVHTDTATDLNFTWEFAENILTREEDSKKTSASYAVSENDDKKILTLGVNEQISDFQFLEIKTLNSSTLVLYAESTDDVSYTSNTDDIPVDKALITLTFSRQ